VINGRASSLLHGLTLRRQRNLDQINLGLPIFFFCQFRWLGEAAGIFRKVWGTARSVLCFLCSLVWYYLFSQLWIQRYSHSSHARIPTKHTRRASGQHRSLWPLAPARGHRKDAPLVEELFKNLNSELFHLLCALDVLGNFIEEIESGQLRDKTPA